jgi:aspartate racemase
MVISGLRAGRKQPVKLMTKHIGIVSVNYEGTALCYRSICAEAASEMGEYHHPQITMHSFPLADYMGFLSRLDWEGVAGLLLNSVEKVARAGADFAICPANTIHEAFKFMRPRSPIPWLHIVEVVSEAAANQGLSKLGILGTKILMEGNVYREVLSNRGIEAVIPQAEQRERINTLIFDELVKGTLESSTREYFRGVVAELAGIGCDGVVMGCTEIPLILRPEDVEAPLLDSTRLLAKAALKESLGGA